MANTPFSRLPLQVRQIQMLLFCFSVLPCHVFNLGPSMAFCASMSNRVLFKTLLPSTQRGAYPSEKITAGVSRHCPSLFNQGETLGGVELGDRRGFCSRT